MVELKVKDGIAGIFLNRPDKSNALGTELLEALLFKLKEIDASPGLRVVVIAGYGKSFCGGADIHELAGLKKASAGKFVRKIHQCCDAIRHLPVPVVARLHGAVIGAGLELAAACDLRIAAEGTRFAMPEVRLGIPSVVEAALLPRLVGAGRAAWLVLTGEPIDARRAHEWGLIEQVGADDALADLVNALLKNDAKALRMQKHLLQLWEEAPLSESIAKSIEYFAG